MSDKNKYQFRISSALKDIIGKELITDDFIAVFELVKNAFDAYAQLVKIVFEGFEDGEPKITIIDNGKGMNYNDLIDKWLFVAYSAKKDGTEDSHLDYRNKIYSHRTFAGAKGIGRFSCDRLGSKLKLSTLKDEPKSKIEQLIIDWHDFELNSKKEFVDVNVIYDSRSKNEFEFNHGTSLEISNLRSDWDRDKLLRLKHSLEKLINPNQENDSRRFSIKIEAPHERHLDRQTDDPRKKVNGTIDNTIFETLGLKTTQIKTTISKDGFHITTELIDRGLQIYSITESNKYQTIFDDPNSLLKDIQFNLFYLSFAAKLNFNIRMGIRSHEYGSVFLYKNGFRIHPHGEPGYDYLEIDKRKAQGTRRFLGTRELIGRIEINDNNNRFQETTSRDGGLVKTKEYYALKSCFTDKCLRRLEKYVVDVIHWGNDEDYDNLSSLSDIQTKDRILDTIAKLTSAEDVIDIRYDTNFLKLLNSQQDKSLSKIFKNFKRLANDSNNPFLLKEAEKAERQLSELRQAKEEAENETDKTRHELEKEKRKNLYLLAAAKDTTPEVLGLIHHIGLETTEIDSLVENMINDIKKDKYEISSFLKDLQKIKLHSDRTLKISKLITRSNFDSQVEEAKNDLARYIKEYIQLYSDIHKDNKSKIPHIKFISPDVEFMYRFRMIDISIIFDNLISNSKKALAQNIIIKVENYGKQLLVQFSDDSPKGIDDKIKDDIFELGITTTKGSGIGLYTVRDLLKQMGGTIKYIGNGKILSGATFQMDFTK